MKIKILHNEEIDAHLWDKLIEHSPQSSIFHYRWFLELIDDDWSALIGENYQWVMPFFSSQKKIIKNTIVPYLGIVSARHISVNEFDKIINYCNKKFIGVEYAFSKYHQKDNSEEKFNLRKYAQKDLVKRYNNTKKTFHKKVEQCLTTANEEKLNCISLRSTQKFSEFLKTNAQFSEDEIFVLRKIIDRSTREKSGKMYAIYNRTNELCAVTFILFSRSKAYNMVSCFTEEALKQKADYKIINTIIEDLSLFNITFENHSNQINEEVFEAFGFNYYYYYEYQNNRKQNLLSLMLQYLKL